MKQWGTVKQACPDQAELISAAMGCIEEHVRLICVIFSTEDDLHADEGRLVRIQEQLVSKLVANKLPPICYIPVLKGLLEDQNLSADQQVGS